MSKQETIDKLRKIIDLNNEKATQECNHDVKSLLDNNINIEETVKVPRCLKFDKNLMMKILEIFRNMFSVPPILQTDSSYKVASLRDARLFMHLFDDYSQKLDILDEQTKRVFKHVHCKITITSRDNTRPLTYVQWLPKSINMCSISDDNKKYSDGNRKVEFVVDKFIPVYEFILSKLNNPKYKIIEDKTNMGISFMMDAVDDDLIVLILFKEDVIII